MRIIILSILLTGLLSLLSCTGMVKSEKNLILKEESMPVDYNNLFEDMCRKKDREYLQLEAQLIAGGEEAVKSLKSKLNNNDPFTQLMARVYIKWIDAEGEEYQEALKYLFNSLEGLKGTPVSFPSSAKIAYNLNKQHEDRVVDILVVKLVKHIYVIKWMASGVLTYLKEQQQPSPIAGILRYIEEESDQQMIEYAVTVIQAINDPKLKIKLTAEKNYRNQSGETFSPYLEALLK